jgi:hypothetical protein
VIFVHDAQVRGYFASIAKACPQKEQCAFREPMRASVA